MTYAPRANRAFNCGVEAYLIDDVPADFVYATTVPFEFVMHAYRDGMLTVEESASGDPVVYLKRCKARSTMAMGDSIVSAGGVVCDITNDANVPADALFLMYERGLIRPN